VDALIGSYRKVGESAIVGTAAVVAKDVRLWQIIGGNPASVLRERSMQSGASFEASKS